MYAGHWLTWGFHRRWLQLPQAASFKGFGLGIWLGIVAVTMWQQWNLTFGQDPDFLLAVAVSLSLSTWVGQFLQRSRGNRPVERPLVSLVVGLSLWSLLHPYWIDSLTIMMGWTPIAWLENSTMRVVVAMSVALLGWIIPGSLWSMNFAAWAQGSNESTKDGRRAFASLMFGIAVGLVLNSIVLAPQFGLYPPVIAASILACIVSLLHKNVRNNPVDPGTFHEIADGSASFFRILMRFAVMCLVGCLVACHLRLANQLLPHGAFVLPVQMAGMIGGMGIGFWLASLLRRPSDRTSWGILFAVISSSLLLGMQPNLVDLSLRMNVNFTTPDSLLGARVFLMMLIACPFGVALAWIVDASTQVFRPNSFGWMAPIGLGLGTATFALSGRIELAPMMAGCVSLLVAGSALHRMQRPWLAGFWPMMTATTCVAAVSITLPLWRTCDDASRTAKLLFSTPTFVAYRSGWGIDELPSLDDIRLIDRKEGRTGPLTLWRGHVAELYLREAGIPRTVVSKQSEILPQFPPEVLQSVYSMVLADRPARVLMLGLSAGVPLSTCLNFPIREVVCIEGDSNLIGFVRGPLARETGFDPLNDERVSLRQIAPELAIMTRPEETFDVVLSCPTTSWMTEGGAAFTQEYYQRASRQLAERGLFCQRLECIDYGPEPLRMVLKAMQSAFQNVMAIETSMGELLLFAANCPDLFVSNELPARLEMPHVRSVLARSGLDWSILLNQVTLDNNALKEICDESQIAANSTFNGLLAVKGPKEVMRWGNKYQEIQNAFMADRSSEAPPEVEAARNRQVGGVQEIRVSRRSRLIEWLNEAQVSKELLRRLEEVATQQKIVRENPDEHWWKYRKALRKQLQEHPRAAVQLVKAIGQKRKMHPEDEWRRDYFLALGEAATRSQPTREQISQVESYLEPYDPLLSYFARQETAEMLGRTDADPARELMYRLHVIYFAPSVDASVRNVSKALAALVKHPESIPDDSNRFDALNGLIQTLRVRWEIRQTIKEDSSQKIMQDIDQSLLAVEKGLAMLDEVHSSAGVSEDDWKARRQVIDRLLLRPLRTYRNEMSTRQFRGQAEAKAILDDAVGADDDLK